jgi:hypothetical protein
MNVQGGWRVSIAKNEKTNTIFQICMFGFKSVAINIKV